jgi:hypothetical protein
MHQRGNFIGVGVEREVTGVENVNLGMRQVGCFTGSSPRADRCDNASETMVTNANNEINQN